MSFFEYNTSRTGNIGRIESGSCGCGEKAKHDDLPVAYLTRGYFFKRVH